MTGHSTTWAARAAEALALTLALALAHAGPALAQADPATGSVRTPQIVPFSSAATATPPPPWRAVGLPRGKAPLADMQVLPVDGERALRLRTSASYGTLVHPLDGYSPGPRTSLSWRWRLDEPVAGTDLRQRTGDDSPLKLCLMFDMPLDRLSLWERSVLRMARAASSQPLPAATLCYLWEPTLPAGTVLPNVYSARVRFMVLDGTQSTLGQWRQHERLIAADFLRAFGEESPQVPALLAVVAGADSDNTGGSSTAWLSDLRIGP